MTEAATDCLLTRFIRRDNVTYALVNQLLAAERELLDQAKGRSVVHRTDFPHGALTMDLASGVRFVVMYDIQTDTHVTSATLLVR